MRLIYVANVRFPTEKAHGLQIMKMCEALAGNGLDVELIVPWRKNEIAGSPFSFWGIKNVFSIKKIGTFDFASFGFLPAVAGFLLNSLYFSFNVFNYLRINRNFQYIYIRDRELILPLVLLRRPFILEIHALPKFIWLYRFLWNKAERIIVITEHLKGSLIKIGISEKKILVLPDAVDLGQFDIVGSKDEFKKRLCPEYLKRKLIVYTGQLYPWKGVDTLVKAADYLDDSFKIIIVGGWDEGRISELKRLQKKQGSVYFYGHAPYQEIPLWLKAADVLVLPNSGRYAISRYHTSPMKLFEYMASQVPIVSSDLPSIREILTEKEAEFFRSDDPESLAKAIKKVSADNKRSADLSSAAYLKVQKYTWKNRALQIENIFNTL